ncbi:MAG: hypothetical protein CM15mP129_04970 [Chloroflexota bacterium]|nr:MAG: hypothetical protein CM15mP129_04970 [Chloroflexota bacterium]
MSFKPLNLNIIQEVQHHECNGKCTGKNGNDGYCYHEKKWKKRKKRKKKVFLKKKRKKGQNLKVMKIFKKVGKSGGGLKFNF